MQTSDQVGIIWCREGESNPQGTKYRRILSPLRLPVPPSRHCWKVLVTDRSHTFSSTRADVILRLRNPLQNPRVPYEILPLLALTARHVVARSCSDGRLLRAEASSIADLPVVAIAPPSLPGAGHVPPVFAFFSTRSFHAVRSARQYARRRQTDLRVSHRSPAAGILFSGPPHQFAVSYRLALCGGRHEENLSHLDRRTARFGALARPRQRLVYVSAFQDP